SGGKLTQEEFADQLRQWKQELVDEVIAYYRNDNSEQGRLAFSRWKERFGIFLREHVPDEARNTDPRIALQPGQVARRTRKHNR
ncbi:MAG TPA: hypothetical protein VI837_11275, partial [Blastocatellia bacterium]|nr:hypothetical protein [Blastocatellia bacterium]